MIGRAVFFLCFIAPACSLQCWGPAQAGEPVHVGAAELCAVKNAIRWQAPAWTAAECERVAAALNDTDEPELMRAVCTNESDLNARAHRVTFLRDGRIAHDVGLCGVRCVLYPSSIETARGYGPRSAVDTADLATGRCVEGPARGLTVRQLMDPVVNIRTAAAIMATKKRPGNYNAGDPEKAKGYEHRIAALVSAWAGEVRIPKGARGRKWARIKALAPKIANAVTGGKRS